MIVSRTVIIWLSILPQCLLALKCVTQRVSGGDFSYEPAPEPHSNVVSTTKIADSDVTSSNVDDFTPSTDSGSDAIDAHAPLNDDEDDGYAVFEMINGRVECGREARLLKQIAELSEQVKATKIRTEQQVKACKMRAESLQTALKISQARERELEMQLEKFKSSRPTALDLDQVEKEAAGTSDKARAEEIISALKQAVSVGYGEVGHALKVVLAAIERASKVGLTRIESLDVLPYNQDRASAAIATNIQAALQDFGFENCNVLLRPTYSWTDMAHEHVYHISELNWSALREVAASVAPSLPPPVPATDLD